MRTALIVWFTGGIAAIACAADAPVLKADHKEEVERQLIKVERAWNEAFKTRDKAALNSLCSEDFVLTDDEGRTSDKKRYIGEALTAVKVTSYTLTEFSVKSYGDTGIVVGKWAGNVSVDGHDTETSFRFTDTFVRRQEHWWAVASHMSKIAGNDNGN